MPMYLVQGNYSADAWARLMKKPEDREASLRKAVESMGGKLHAFYFTFGQSDVCVLMEMPDNKSMMAAAIIATAGGASPKTTVLISAAEAKKAMQLAKSEQSKYTPPGGKAGKGSK